MRLVIALLVLVCGLFAQDGGLVLSTYVNYATNLANSKLAPEKKAELDANAKKAMGLSAQGQYSAAMKLLYRGLAEMAGAEWTPERSLASSLTYRADHAVWEPGQKVRLTAKRLYPPDAGAPESLKATITLNDTKVDEWTITGETPEFTLTVPQIAAGNATLSIALPATARPKTVAVSIQPGLRDRVAKLDARLAKLKTPAGTALWTTQYASELFRRIDRSELAATNFDLPTELAKAETYATALEAGREALPAAPGRDIRLAYLSKADNTLQPYRLYTPKSWTSEKAFPLVVALHGMGGDENTLFDRYGQRDMIREAEKHNFIVVAPKGREPASMYRGLAEQDVMDVLAQVRADYKIDPARIYMMGHSMGGYGTWSTAMDYPDIFAALGPIAGGGQPAGMEKVRHIPQIVIHGDDDRTVPVTQSRNMVEAGRKFGTEIEYVEVPGGSHTGVAAPAFPKIFDFFESHSKKPAAAAASGGR